MLCSWREFSFDQLAEQKGGWGRLVKHPGLVHRSASLLKSREKFLPGRCNQRLCRCMPVSADNIAAFSTSFKSAASTMSTTSKRPSVAKLSFHVTPGHSRLIFSDTSLAKALKSLGSSNAPGEMRLRITNAGI